MNTANPWWGDPSYRVFPRTATERDVVASHLHIETAYLERDLDVVLPLRRLAELEGEGIVGRAAPSHYSVQGYLLDPTEFLATSVPAIVERMKRDEVDAAIFLPSDRSVASPSDWPRTHFVRLRLALVL